MQVVFLEAPENLLAERSRLGLDSRDEMWEGQLHVVPQPYFSHQERNASLAVVLGPVVRALGLRMATEPAMYAGDQSWRVPELAIARSDQIMPRGIEGNGAILAVEIRSPRDETDAKIPFYARFGLAELVIVDRDTAAVELLRLSGGALNPVAADQIGWVTCSLQVAFRQGDAGFLEVRLPDGSVTHC